MRDKVEAALDEIRPALMADGGKTSSIQLKRAFSS